MTSTLPATAAASRPQTVADGDFKVADLSLAAFGRKEIQLAEHEMPGLMAIRREYAQTQPLRGARITGSLHMTIQTAVLIETLVALGAQVRWASCNIFSTQDHAAAAVAVGPTGTAEAPAGVPVYAWKGETLPEYWWCTEQVLLWPDGGGPNMILDDGGDATLLVHKGAEFEAAGAVPATAETDSEEYGVILDVLRRSLAEDAQRWTRVAAGIKGVTEETTTGVHRLYEMQQRRHAALPGDQRQRLGDQVEVRQQVRLPALADRRHQPGHRRAHRRQGRGRAAATATSARAAPSRCAARAPASSSPRSTRSARCRRRWTATRSPRSTTSSPTADIFITATGCFDVITAEHMAQMKHQAIVGNIGHFDNEIDMAGLAKRSGRHAGQRQAAGRRVGLRRRPLDHRAVRGPAAEPGQRDRAPVVRDVELLHATRRSPRSSCSPRPTSTRSASTRCPSTSTRRWPGCTSAPSA